MPEYIGADEFLQEAQIIERRDGRYPRRVRRQFDSSDFFIEFEPVDNMKWFEWMAVAEIDNLTEKYEMIEVTAEVTETIISGYAHAFAFVSDGIPDGPIFNNWEDVSAIYNYSNDILTFDYMFSDILEYDYMGIGMYYDWITTDRRLLPEFTVDNPEVSFQVNGVTMVENPFHDLDLTYEIEIYRAPFDGGEWELIKTIETEDYDEWEIEDEEVTDEEDYCYMAREVALTGLYSNIECTYEPGYDSIEIALEDAVRGLGHEVILHGTMTPEGDYAGEALEYQLERRLEDGDEWIDVGTFTRDGLLTQFMLVDEDAQPNEDYCYRMREMKFDTDWTDELCVDAPTWPELMQCVYIPVIWDLYVDDVELTTEIVETVYDVEENEVDFSKAAEFGVSLTEDDIDWYEVNQHIGEFDYEEFDVDELYEVCSGVWDEDIPDIPVELFEPASAVFWSTVPHFIPKQSFMGIGFNYSPTMTYEDNIEVHVAGLETEEQTPAVLGIGFNYWPVMDSHEKY